MADVSNITKFEYTLNSPDSIILTGTARFYVTNQSRRKKPAKTVLYEKSVGEKAYYAVQTAADINKVRHCTFFQRLYVYRRKKVQKEASQSTDTNSPSAMPEAEFAKALSAKITQQEQDVKQKYSYSTEINFTMSCTRTLFIEEEITSREHSINEY